MLWKVQKNVLIRPCTYNFFKQTFYKRLLTGESHIFKLIFLERSNYQLNFIFVCRVYLCKQWQDLKVFNEHTTLATGVRFGKHAQYLASTSMDRTLKLYGLE